jgi:probable rRNA maturation factor
MNPRELLSRIQVLSRQRRFKIYRESVALFCAALLQSLDQPNRAVSVVFVGARTMRSLNRRYLHRDYATDVLSFPYEGATMDGMPFLGEIVVSPETAVRQAARCRACPEKELRKLLVHGILHLLGYDHETDGGRMNRRQTALLRRKSFMDLPALADFKVRK